jgi:dephospho-CoA kinase
MFNVGITGSLGAGKSQVTALFGRWGATVIDADRIVRELQAPGTPVTTAIARRFGSDILSASGAVDRGRLRARIVADPDERAALNAIVHPAVARRRDELLLEAERRGDTIVVNEIPLLFEVLDPALFDAIVVVDAPEDVRRQRVVAQRAISQAEVSGLMASQLDPAEKRRRADYVIDNDGSLDDLERRARDVWQHLRAAADDVRTNG